MTAAGQAERVMPTRAALEAETRSIVGFESARSEFLRRTDNSVLYRLRIPASDTSYLLKVCNRTKGARLQYDSLVNAREAMGEGPLSVPEPAFILPASGAYCIDFVPGRSVRQLVDRKVSSGSTRARAVERCGEWIARYHDVFGNDARELDIDNRLESLEEDVRSINELASDDGSIRRIRDWMLDNVATVGCRKVPWGKLHGDFKPDNLLVSGDRLLGIDIELYADGVQFMDLVQFINNIVLLSFTNPGLRIANGGDRLADALLRGYFGSADRGERFALRWLRVLHLLHTMNMCLTHGGLLSMRRYGFLRSQALGLIDRP